MHTLDVNILEEIKIKKKLPPSPNPQTNLSTFPAWITVPCIHTCIYTCAHKHSPEFKQYIGF